MKRLKHIVFAFMAGLMVLVGCGSGKVPEPFDGPSSELAAIDSLLQQQPDSALAYLEWFDSIDYGDARAPYNHYLNLMLAEAVFKVRYEVVLADELGAAMACFDSMAETYPQADNLAFLSARAHYMNAICLNEAVLKLDDSLTMTALQGYYKALEIMENHFSDKDLTKPQLKFMSTVSNKIASIYSALFIHKPTVYFTKKSLEINRSMDPPPTSSIARSLFLLGYEFDKTEQFDSALYYFDQALELIPDTNSLIYRTTTLRRTINAYKLNLDGATALEQLKRSLPSCPEMLKSNVLSTIGWVYFEEKQYDSALAYLEPVFEKSTDETQQMQTAQTLCQVYEALGDTVNMAKYSRFFTQNATIGREMMSQNVKYEQLFNDYIQRREEQMARQEKEKTIRTTLAVVLPMAVLAILLSVVAMKRRGKKRMEKERQTHRMEQAALSGRLKRSNETLRELQDQVRQQGETTTKPETQAASFAEEPICRLIMERVNEGQFKSKVSYLDYSDYALSKEQITALREAADRHFGQFTIRLAKAYPDLTKSDLNYCCLYLLDLNDADIAALMQRAYNTVSDRSRKLKTLFGSEEPLSTILRGLATKEQFH